MNNTFFFFFFAEMLLERFVNKFVRIQSNKTGLIPLFHFHAAWKSTFKVASVCRQTLCSHSHLAFVWLQHEWSSFVHSNPFECLKLTKQSNQLFLNQCLISHSNILQGHIYCPEEIRFAPTYSSFKLNFPQAGKENPGVRTLNNKQLIILIYFFIIIVCFFYHRTHTPTFCW